MQRILLAPFSHVYVMGWFSCPWVELRFSVFQKRGSPRPLADVKLTIRVLAELSILPVLLMCTCVRVVVWHVL